MSTSAFTGPLIAFGHARSPNTGLGAALDYNPAAGPSSFEGWGLLDTRAQFSYVPGQNDTHPYYLWSGTGDLVAMDVVPYTATVGAIAAAQPLTSGTAMTLASVAATGVTVGATTTNFNTGAAVTGLVCIDAQTAGVAFGSAGTTNVWDPTTTLARAVAITAAAGATGGAITLKGYDIFGVPMTETITAAAGSQINGKKAWKFIASATPAFTDASHNYSIDTTDIIGFPLYVSIQGYADILYPQPAVITSATGFTAGVTATATATTGDVRGTYALQSASNNANRLMMFITISPANLALGVTGTYGVAQG